MAIATIIVPDMNVAAMSPMSTRRKNCTLVTTNSLAKLFLNGGVSNMIGADRSIIRKEGGNLVSKGHAYT